jgi:LPXTG-motif cell wall-anchored protein
MGFNIQQYDMYDNDSYSNAGGCGILHPFNKGKREACEQARNEKKGSGNTSADTALSKGAVCVKGLPIYTPALYLVTSKDKRTQNRMICKARKEAKVKDDVVPADAVKDNPLTDAQAPTGTDTGSASSTGMYVGIGVGILAIGIVAIVLIKRRKK